MSGGPSPLRQQAIGVPSAETTTSIPGDTTVKGSRRMAADDLISVTLQLPAGELDLLQPEDGAELPDDHEVEWAPLAPSLAASRAGAAVLATDADPEALDLLLTNAARNGVELQTARVNWSDPAELVAAAPFDLALASDVLYQRAAVAQLLSLLPRLATWVLLADPGRPAAAPSGSGAASRYWSAAPPARRSSPGPDDRRRRSAPGGGWRPR